MTGHHRHDRAHRALFSHRQMIEDLLRHFVAEPWVEELDFGSLQRENEASTDGATHRQRDMVWSVRWRESALYVILFLEFQSQPEPFMVLRQLSYLAMFYEDLVKAKRLRPGDRLPPVLPIVSYNGDAPWRAPRALEEMWAEIPESLKPFQPSFRYLLLDELNTEVALGEERNTLGGLMALQQSETEEQLRSAAAALQVWLRHPEDLPLLQGFDAFVRRMIPPELIGNGTLIDLAGNDMMRLTRNYERDLAASRMAGENEGRTEGRKEGRNEGRKEGRAEGQRALLVKLLQLKFGPLSAEDAGRVATAGMSQLETWASRVLTARVLAEVW